MKTKDLTGVICLTHLEKLVVRIHRNIQKA